MWGRGPAQRKQIFKKNCRRVAVDWGRKADYLEHYQLVIFVTCRDLNGRKELHIYYNYRNMPTICVGKQGLNKSNKTKQIHESKLIKPSTVATFSLAVRCSIHESFSSTLG
jgi:hypothetical protein